MEKEFGVIEAYIEIDSPWHLKATREGHSHFTIHPVLLSVYLI